MRGGRRVCEIMDLNCPLRVVPHLVCRHRLLQSPNLPYDGEHDGAAARDVHQVQNIRPRHVPLGALGGGRDEEDGDVVHHLEEKDGEDHLFLLGGKEGLEERPATAKMRGWG